MATTTGQSENRSKNHSDDGNRQQRKRNDAHAVVNMEKSVKDHRKTLHSGPPLAIVRDA